MDKFDDLVSDQKWLIFQYEELLSATEYDLLNLDSKFILLYYKYSILIDVKKKS